MIVAPGAPQGRGVFGDEEILYPRLLELDRHAQPGEASADDGDVNDLGVVGWRVRIHGVYLDCNDAAG